MSTTDLEKFSPHAIELMDQLGIKLADPQQLAWRIGQRLASAGTPEELFAEQGANGWEEQEGKLFTVRNVWWLPSAFTEGAGFYAVVEAVNENGELTVLTTGSTGVMIQLARAAQMGWLDKQPLKLERNAQPTSSGYYPHRLKLA